MNETWEAYIQEGLFSEGLILQISWYLILHYILKHIFSIKCTSSIRYAIKCKADCFNKV